MLSHNPDSYGPSSLITWALRIGIAWLIFAGLTGLDDWQWSIFKKGKSRDLEKRVEKLERQLVRASGLRQARRCQDHDQGKNAFHQKAFSAVYWVPNALGNFLF